MTKNKTLYICEECLKDFEDVDVFWCFADIHKFILCEKCLKKRKIKQYETVKKDRKKRVIEKQYFKCKKCENITYRDKKDEYNVRQLCCKKCSDFKTLEKYEK